MTQSRRPYRGIPIARGRSIPAVATTALLLVLVLGGLSCDGVWCPPENRCGARCVDLDTDPNHCGTCGVRCIHPAQCQGGVCEAPCPHTYHDGGDGSCVPRGRCSPGFHDGGDGVCVAEDSCRPGYRDGGDGTCFPNGACAPGHHDGGDGSCHPDGECAEGHAPDRHGTCRVPGPCSEGLVATHVELPFGRARPGGSKSRLIAIAPHPGTGPCRLGTLSFHDGTASAFSLDSMAELPEILDVDTSLPLSIDYRPERFGQHVGHLVITADDPHAEPTFVGLDAAALDTSVLAEDARVDLGEVAIGDTARRWTCIRNTGEDAERVTAVRLEAVTEGDLDLEHVPEAGTLIESDDGRLCVQIQFRPTRAGLHADAVVFEIDDGYPPLVVQIVADAL